MGLTQKARVARSRGKGGRVGKAEVEQGARFSFAATRPPRNDNDTRSPLIVHESTRIFTDYAKIRVIRENSRTPRRGLSPRSSPRSSWCLWCPTAGNVVLKYSIMGIVEPAEANE